MPSSSKTISVETLKEGMPGITCHIGGCLAEAAAVCLEEQGHSSGVTLSVIGSKAHSFVIEWLPVTDQMLRSWSDPEEATEYGACCLALLLITKTTDFTVIQRSRKGTGFDYWLGNKKQAADLPFAKKVRLEVSGIRKGDDHAVDYRCNMKWRQVNKFSTSTLPAYVVVVEFSNPLSKMESNGANR